MENDIIILEEVANSTQTEVKKSTIRYAWGNSSLKTWYITRSSKEFLPKGCKLLFKISGEEVNDPISVTESFPKEGDVICDLDGSHIKVIDVNWI